MEIPKPGDYFMATMGGADQRAVSDHLFSFHMQTYLKSTLKWKESKYNKQLDDCYKEMGCYYYRPVPGVGVCALYRLAFTVGLVVNPSLDEYSDQWRYRYCFPTLKEATMSLIEWDGNGHPPGGWIKRKGEGGDLRNPLSESEFD